MSNSVISVEGLSKLYEIGIAKQRHDTLRDQLSDGFRSLFQRNGKGASKEGVEKTFWALRDVSFEIKSGDVVGIIGRNGAGKSTLLKILSRITKPTKGRADIHGRVGSLLEVGTGFHPELTGRENIFLNGAILGMKKQEIARKFHDIVAFADINRFIDTPVKRYSSGMYVRLAFAVAAHLEPEVLIVDEVLAVGDFAFQKKCLGRMSEVADRGRTVLFVSHNLAAVENLCNKVILLEGGQVVYSGTPAEVIKAYLNSLSDGAALPELAQIDLTSAAGRPPNYRQMLTSTELFTDDDVPVSGCVRLGAPLKMSVSFQLDKPTPHLEVTVVFQNNLGQRVMAISSVYQPDPPSADRPGDHTLVCELPSLPLLPGEYHLSIFLDVDGMNVDRVEDAVRIIVVESDYYGNGKVQYVGHMLVQQRWYHAEKMIPKASRVTSINEVGARVAIVPENP
jgi:lipopolysaccharide transport system ATP-binding protein